jgi:hypothetical protein
MCGVSPTWIEELKVHKKKQTSTAFATVILCAGTWAQLDGADISCLRRLNLVVFNMSAVSVDRAMKPGAEYLQIDLEELLVDSVITAAKACGRLRSPQINLMHCFCHSSWTSMTSCSRRSPLNSHATIKPEGFFVFLGSTWPAADARTVPFPPSLRGNSDLLFHHMRHLTA